MSMSFTQPRNVYGLVRVSKEESAQEGAAGVSRQIADIQRLARKYNLNLLRIFEVIDVSGQDVLRDPQIQEILRDMEKPDVQGLVLSALDRLARPGEFDDFIIYQPFRKNKKILWTAREGEIDASTPEGRQRLLNAGGQAGSEWDEIRRRTIDGKNDLRAQGYHVQGDKYLPRGVKYHRNPGKKSGYYEFDPAFLPRVLKAFELLEEGANYTSLMALLGYKDSGAVRRLLANPIWMGRRVYTREAQGEKVFTAKGKKYRKPTLRETPLDVRTNLEPIMTAERWAHLQDLIARRRGEWTKTVRLNKGESEFLLLGIGRCGVCGAKLYGRAKSRNRGGLKYYYCSSRHKGQRCGARPVPRERVERGVEAVIENVLLEAGFLQGLLDIAAQAAEDERRNRAAEAQAQAVMNKIAKVKAERGRIKDGYQEGIYTAEECKKRLQAADQDIRQLEASMPNRTAARAFDPVVLAGLLMDTFETFRTLSVDEKKTLLQRAVKEIIVMDQTMTRGRQADPAITGLTFHGGFLGALANGGNSRCSLSVAHQIPTAVTPDFTITFPQPWRLAA